VTRELPSLTVHRDEVADLGIRTSSPVACDVAFEVGATGRSAIVDCHDLAGGGVVLAHRRPESQVLVGNPPSSHGKVTAEERLARNGHVGRVIWLTGLPGAGKSTIAVALERELFNQGKQVYVLDGDRVRLGLAADLTYSPEGRRENIRRAGQVSRLFLDAGMIVVTAFISPYRADRDAVRALLPSGAFVEVFVSAPLEICERRDPKGLYAKARNGEVQSFTGVSAPYEPPLSPEIEVRTDTCTVTECTCRILDYLNQASSMGAGLPRDQEGSPV
jgi:bifunctional enzyme CysN/CysC